jgi:hypothetical protein
VVVAVWTRVGPWRRSVGCHQLHLSGYTLEARAVVKAWGKAGPRELVQSLLGELPWFVPGVVLSMTIALFVCGPVGKRLAVRGLVAWAILVGVGVIASATLTPHYGALNPGPVGIGTCDLSRIGPAPTADLLRLDEASLNVALFIPLGIAIGLVQASGLRRSLMVASAALPFGIEAIQMIVPILARGCQSADVVDNLSGFLIGLVAGTALRFVGTGRGWRV